MRCSVPSRTPGGLPDNQMLVPDAVCSSVLEWALFSRLTCHPGSRRTLAFVQQYFWWPSMVPDVSAFVTTCTICAQNTTPRQVPSGLLHPLPVPPCPWSHISLDFVTSVPPTECNTVILTVVDCFPKRPTSFLSTSYPTWCSTTSGSMDCQRTWSPTGVLSS